MHIDDENDNSNNQSDITELVVPYKSSGVFGQIVRLLEMLKYREILMVCQGSSVNTLTTSLTTNDGECGQQAMHSGLLVASVSTSVPN